MWVHSLTYSLCPPPSGRKLEIYVNIDDKTVKFGMKPPCMQSLILDLPASDMHLLLMGGRQITLYPLVEAGMVVVYFFQFVQKCMCQMQV